MANFIDLEDLHEDDFILVQSGNMLKLKVKPKLPEASSILSYTLNQPESSIATFIDNSAGRRNLYLQNSFGYIHLDFIARTATKGNNNTFYLPQNSPIPINIIETQAVGGGMIWISANGREIQWGGLKVGQRYIVDLIGFFRNN